MAFLDLSRKVVVEFGPITVVVVVSLTVDSLLRYGFEGWPYSLDYFSIRFIVEETQLLSIFYNSVVLQNKIKRGESLTFVISAFFQRLEAPQSDFKTCASSARTSSTLCFLFLSAETNSCNTFDYCQDHATLSTLQSDVLVHFAPRY